MKTRKSHISNSSSTSFVIALKKTKDSDHINYVEAIEFIIEMAGYQQSELKYFTGSVMDRKEKIKEENKQLSLDLDWCHKKIENLESISFQNEDVVQVLEKLNLIKNSPMRENDDIRFLRDLDLSDIGTAIQDEIRNIGYHVTKILEDKEQLEKILEKLNQLDDDYSIVGFEEDHWAGICKHMIEHLISLDKAIILEQVST